IRSNTRLIPARYEGSGTAGAAVGTNGAAFGVADNSVMTVMDLLLACDAQAVNGVLYNGNTAKRNMANTVFSGINQAGGINGPDRPPGAGNAGVRREATCRVVADVGTGSVRRCLVGDGTARFGDRASPRAVRGRHRSARHRA